MRITAGDLRQGWEAKEDISTPASFSRFVQPFAFRPVPCDGKPTDFHYKPIGLIHERAERESYLTIETADALFTRALWLRLEPCEGKWHWQYPMRFGPRDLDVCMHAPELILFEWDPGAAEKARARKGRERRGDLLAIGLLVVDVYFPDPTRKAQPESRQTDPSLDPQLEDLLRLNEAFRYWRRPYKKHGAVQELLGQCPVSILQDDLIGSLEGRDVPEKAYFERWYDLLKPPLRVDGQSWTLFPNGERNWGDLPRKCAGQERQGYPAFFYADDKAFVWTCAVLKGGGSRLSKSGGGWAKLLNVDPPTRELEQCSQFEKEWTDDRTYTRWEESGCLYGFNYHSGAAALPENLAVPAWDHFATMYFDIAMLLFYLRLASFRFSARLYGISAEARQDGGEVLSQRWHKAFGELRRSFSWFTNLYQFPLISNKQQAIEMYGLMRRSMDIQELFQEIQSEIHNSHEYLLQHEAREQTRLANSLNVVAMAGLGLALAVGFLGMNLFMKGGAISVAALRTELAAWVLLLGVTLAAFSLIVLSWSNAELLIRWLRKRGWAWQGGAVAVLLVLFGLLFQDAIGAKLRLAWLYLRNMFL